MGRGVRTVGVTESSARDLSPVVLAHLASASDDAHDLGLDPVGLDAARQPVSSSDTIEHAPGLWVMPLWHAGAAGAVGVTPAMGQIPVRALWMAAPDVAVVTGLSDLAAVVLVGAVVRQALHRRLDLRRSDDARGLESISGP